MKTTNKARKGTAFAYPVCGEPFEVTIKNRNLKGYYNAKGEWIRLTKKEKARIINGD